MKRLTPVAGSSSPWALRGEADRLRSALAALIARVRRTGGYATPEEQGVLWQAEQALESPTAGMPNSGPAVPVAAFSADAPHDVVGRKTEQSSGLLGAAIERERTGS